MNIDDTLFTPQSQDNTVVDLTDKLTDKEQAFVSELYDGAVANYQKYLELNQNAEDKADVETQIEKINEARNPDKGQPQE